MGTVSGGSFEKVSIFSNSSDIKNVFPHLEGPLTKSLKFSFSLISNIVLLYDRKNLLKKGRGIGGLLRAASSLFKPLFKTVGSTALKVARSDTGKAIGKALKEQAIRGSQNIALDTIRGENIK